MGTCLSCGKKGIFLKVNNSGRCKNCEIVYEQNLLSKKKEEQNNAYQAYILLSNLFCNFQERVSLPTNPIEQLEFIPEIENRISTCNRFIETLLDLKELKYFSDILDQQCDFNSKSDRYLKYAYFQAFDLKILIHQYSHNESLLHMFTEQLIKEATTWIKRWNASICRIKKNADFEIQLQSIPSVTVELSDQHFSKLSVSNLDELIKYSRITSKTNYDKIGNFIAIDIETTGLSSYKDEIIEISAIRFEDWTPIDHFHSMIKPIRGIPSEITALTGITNEMVKNAPSFESIIPNLATFLGKHNLIGYNLPFDLKFIYHHGLDFTFPKRKYYDVLDIVKSTLKKPKMKWDRELESYEINYDYDYDVENHKLTTVCEYYDIRDSSSAHRASSDALATAIIFKKLVLSRTSDVY